MIKLSYPQLAVRGGRQLPKWQIRWPWRCFSWWWLGYKAVWLSWLCRTLPLLRQQSDLLAINASRLRKSMRAWWRLQGLFTASSCLRPCNEERGTLINISDPSSWHVSFLSARKQASKKGGGIKIPLHFHLSIVTCESVTHDPVSEWRCGMAALKSRRLPKGKVHPKRKILSSFTLNFSSVEFKRRYFEKVLFCPSNGSQWSSELLPTLLKISSFVTFRFGTKWGWVNHDRILIFGGVNYPFKECPFQMAGVGFCPALIT